MASLVSADPVRSFESTAHALPWPLAAAMRVLLKVVPTDLVRVLVGAAWRLRQRFSFARMTQPAVAQVWGVVRNHGLR